MNPYALAVVHGDNIGMYRHALGASKPAETIVLGTLIAMEATLVVELEGLLSELGQLQAAQTALAGPTASHPALRLVAAGTRCRGAASSRGGRRAPPAMTPPRDC